MKRLLVLALVFALIACSSSPGRTAIEGFVTGDGGTPLPGVVVTATDASGNSRSATTDANGRYSIAGVAAGEYTVVAALDGFATTTRRVRTTSNGIAITHMALRLGAVAESVTVTAAAPMRVGDRKSVV
jgi:hypothetical protein